MTLMYHSYLGTFRRAYRCPQCHQRWPPMYIVDDDGKLVAACRRCPLEYGADLDTVVEIEASYYVISWYVGWVLTTQDCKGLV